MAPLFFLWLCFIPVTLLCPAGAQRAMGHYESHTVSAVFICILVCLHTQYQAFLTHEALANIATTTLKNLDDYFAGAPLENEICYRCLGTGGAAKSNCPRRANGRCHCSTTIQSRESQST